MCPVMAPAVARRAAVGERMRARAAMVIRAVRVAMMVLMGLKGWSWGPAMPSVLAYRLVAMTITVEVRLMMWAAIRAVMMVVVSGRDERAATLAEMTMMRARAPKVPMRESVMISRERARSYPPLMPSKVSASPSSWNAPVRSAVAAVAIRTATMVGSARLAIPKARAATDPMMAPTRG